ncbi:RING finger protein 151-like isoform X2 [Ptychodera flava]|uniref:RING finger protein 151-like isoform X2 n=1 Tax=Ptychodera flava TaxID=63121 RepID=UPI00396A7558
MSLNSDQNKGGSEQSKNESPQHENYRPLETHTVPNRERDQIIEKPWLKRSPSGLQSERKQLRPHNYLESALIFTSHVVLSPGPVNHKGFLKAMGYDIERFVGQVNEGLLCCICRDVLEDPLQAPCEHAFCSSCIQGWLVHENICPEDRRTLLITQLRPLFRYMKNDLNKLEVCCSNADNGCTFITTLENIDRHENECDFGRVSCPSNGCGAVMERRNLNSHLATCEFRTKVCPKGCGLTILSKEDEDHNCIGELRTELELLRSEMICKLEDQRKEMQLRLDSQRSHMVQKTSQMQQQIDELRGYDYDCEPSRECDPRPSHVCTIL